MLTTNIKIYHNQMFERIFNDYFNSIEACRSDIDYRKALKREVAYNTVLDIKNSASDFIQKIKLCLNNQLELKQVISGCMPARLQAEKRYEKLLDYCVEFKYCYEKHLKKQL